MQTPPTIHSSVGEAEFFPPSREGREPHSSVEKRTPNGTGTQTKVGTRPVLDGARKSGSRRHSNSRTNADQLGVTANGSQGSLSHFQSILDDFRARPWWAAADPRSSSRQEKEQSVNQPQSSSSAPGEEVEAPPAGGGEEIGARGSRTPSSTSQSHGVSHSKDRTTTDDGGAKRAGISVTVPAAIERPIVVDWLLSEGTYGYEPSPTTTGDQRGAAVRGGHQQQEQEHMWDDEVSALDHPCPSVQEHMEQYSSSHQQHTGGTQQHRSPAVENVPWPSTAPKSAVVGFALGGSVAPPPPAAIARQQASGFATSHANRNTQAKGSRAPANGDPMTFIPVVSATSSSEDYEESVDTLQQKHRLEAREDRGEAYRLLDRGDALVRPHKQQQQEEQGAVLKKKEAKEQRERQGAEKGDRVLSVEDPLLFDYDGTSPPPYALGEDWIQRRFQGMDLHVQKTKVRNDIRLQFGWKDQREEGKGSGDAAAAAVGHTTEVMSGGEDQFLDRSLKPRKLGSAARKAPPPPKSSPSPPPTPPPTTVPTTASTAIQGRRRTRRTAHECEGDA